MKDCLLLAESSAFGATAQGLTLSFSRLKRETLSYGHYSASVDEFNDPADWSTSCTTETAVDVLEPLSDVDNPYREYALIFLELAYRIDEWMSSNTNGTLAWVSVSVSLNFPSTQGLTIPEIARQMEIPEQELRRSIEGFRRIAKLDSRDTPRFYWLRARRP